MGTAGKMPSQIKTVHASTATSTVQGDLAPGTKSMLVLFQCASLLSMHT